MEDLFSDFTGNLLENTKKYIDNGVLRDDIDQGTIEWFFSRLGMFTMSNCKAIKSKGRKAGTIGAPAITYVNQIIAERLLSEDGKWEYISKLEAAGSRATSWGTDNEPWARSEFAEMMGFDITETSFETHPDHKFIGGSSDGSVVGSKDIIEIKNPYDPAKHRDNIKMCAEGVYPTDGDYYGQMQGNIMVNNADGCWFVSGDKRSVVPIAYVYVPRDNEYITELEERLVELNEIAVSEVEYILNSKFYKK